MTDLIERLEGPWTPEQVHNLNEYQMCRMVHPFTCGHDSKHGPLIATCDGWICRNAECDYEQTWAHSFMADGSAVKAQRDFVASRDNRFAALKAKEAEHD